MALYRQVVSLTISKGVQDDKLTKGSSFRIAYKNLG
jgi:hypothetical protein